ncbi:hypothetical protein [Ramlibacter rhizophilus]|uniref:hypothetical protein n=1 Tax=Ramlibacter rhizophilus TaxID=1781167 RepID=UPI003B839C16
MAQHAVRPLPRGALLLLCVAYVLPGFVGREPWKAQDMTAFGYMLALAQGEAAWMAPTLLGQPPQFESLLAYWLGAWAIMAAPPGVPADVAARVPFVALLVLTLACTWWGLYHLARRPGAQPVAFAFGGEARPTDYARALADAGLLALIASLGLAQLSHETTPALAQLGCTALVFYGLAALPRAAPWPWIGLLLGLLGLALAGAPTLAVLFATLGAALLWLEGRERGAALPFETARARRATVLGVLAAGAGVAAVVGVLDLWRWRLDGWDRDWPSFARLLLWFTWPAWPLAAWTVWRWRHRLQSRHVALPLGFGVITLGFALASVPSDRALLLGLPALAALAAFALPTLSRTVSALVDWFTLLFFTGCVLVIWVVWISLQTGVPAKPAANVLRLLPGFEPRFTVVAFAAALAGTLAWGWLVRWRVGRHRSALWKSLVLPAGGAALCWLLVMSLWLPVLDYARSYVPSVSGIVAALDRPGCVEVAGLTRAQVAALRHHGELRLREAGASPQCPWRVLAAAVTPDEEAALAMDRWQWVTTVRRPRDADDTLRLYRRASP